MASWLRSVAERLPRALTITLAIIAGLAGGYAIANMITFVSEVIEMAR